MCTHCLILFANIFYYVALSPKVSFVSPFTKDDLVKRGIIDVFFDLEHLTQLFHSKYGSNLQKNCFHEYRQVEPKPLEGYDEVHVFRVGPPPGIKDQEQPHVSTDDTNPLQHFDTPIPDLIKEW